VASFRIRAATLEDLELLVEHRHKMFEEMSHPSADALGMGDKAYRKWAREMIGRRLLRGYIATTRGGRAAASGCVWLRAGPPSPERPSGMVP